MSGFKVLRRGAVVASMMAMAPVAATADPTLGFGLSLSFGAGQTQTGIGLRLFSDNRRDTTVGSVGVDYMFQSQSIRGTVGIARLNDRMYVGLDIGFDFQSSEVGLGVGIGAVGTRNPVATGGGGGGGGGSTDTFF